MLKAIPAMVFFIILKVTYLETEGYIKVSPAKRIRNMKLPKLKLRTFTEKNILDMIDFYTFR